MTDTTDRVRAHYDGAGLVDRIKAVLAPIADEDEPLTVAQLAMLDQFHTRGILATAELAGAAGLHAADHVLDAGCGIGGPARYLASMFGCQVSGVDLSPSFVEAAKYLTVRCGLADHVNFVEGDVLHLPFEDAAFDAVFLQHVAMNIANRAALYAEVRRVLKPGGRFATYDLVLKDGEVIYPVPWARDPSTSFLLTAKETREALKTAGFTERVWRDDTQTALDWFKATAANAPAAGLNLGVVMGAKFPAITGHLGRNIREGRLGVLSAVFRPRLRYKPIGTKKKSNTHTDGRTCQEYDPDAPAGCQGVTASFCSRLFAEWMPEAGEASGGSSRAAPGCLRRPARC